MYHPCPCARQCTLQQRIFDFGFVSSREKLDAMAAATAFCQPSTNDSFSIEHPREAAAMAPAGRRYVLENYSWRAVLDRFEEALEKSIA